MLPFEVGRGRNVFYKIEEGFHMPKQGCALELQGIEPLFIDAFFLQFRENRRIFFTILEFTPGSGDLTKVKLRKNLYIYLVSYFET
ncbi:hypothetical protein CON71_10595 [Bacillus thuringiensis]|uniref:Uncharacterized protein n=1 Tax=Bacillus thuringiensis TaxID=1428 RepID=A0A9X6TNQ2_BACTU|nr:hypothetical protein CON71_10595 [Bacillus thuringiensis]